ncbi:MAG TPA: hypothetical protein VNY51_09425 [Candidatus Dormibacteraeota bacterium]|jgi:hypothetical protein|nr:hypothetical protein [Candidatus Dormibacteraeota bacterium]
MKVSSSHLEELRTLLVEQTAALDSETKAAKVATDARDERAAAVRGLQAGFDICAASFAQDSEVTTNQLNDLPAEVQKVLGYTKAAKPAA